MATVTFEPTEVDSILNELENPDSTEDQIENEVDNEIEEEIPLRRSRPTSNIPLADGSLPGEKEQREAFQREYASQIAQAEQQRAQFEKDSQPSPAQVAASTAYNIGM